MARRWQCGFELTSLTEVSASSGTAPTLASGGGVPRTGTYALRTAATTNTSFVRFHPFTSDQNISGHQGISLLIETALPTASTTILRFSNVANDPLAQVRLTTGGKLQLWNSSGTQVGSDSATTLTTGVYYDIELKCDATTNPGAIALWLNGTLVASGANDVQGSWARILCGIIGTNSTASFLWDDWKLNDDTGSTQTGRTGVGKILHLRPNGDGDNHAWSNTSNGAGSSTNYQLVDEVSPNSATDYVQTGTATTKDYYTLDDTGIGSGDTINCVLVGMQLRNNTADATAAVKAGIKKVTGGTITQGSAIIPNGTSFVVNQAAEPRVYGLVTYLDPDGAAWTQATLDTAQAGIELTAAGTNRIQVSALWVSIDYTPSSSTPISSSDTGSGAEDSTLATALTATDTGVGAEASTLAATAASADTGAGVDAGTLAAALASADTGSGVEASSLTTAITSPETGTAAEGSSLTATAASADTASGADAATLAVQVFDADTGAAVESGSLATALLDGDTGSGLDQTTDRTLGAAETAAATEAATLATVLTSSDTGSATDTGSLAATLASTDTGTAVDAATQAAALTSTDTAAGLEASTLTASLTSTETGTGGDAGTVDDGSGSDQNVSSSDTGSGSESATLATAITSADTATAVEAATVAVQLTSADTAIAVDAASLTAVLLAADTGIAIEDRALTAALIAADTATATEAATADDGIDEDPLPPVVALITISGRLSATLTPTGQLSAIATRGE